MCNLSRKIKEAGIEIGIEMGKREMIMKMYNKGYTCLLYTSVVGFCGTVTKKWYNKQ